MKLEYCFICDEETGNAGRDEDSLYDLDERGPYCEECYKKLPEDKKEQ